MTKVSIVLATYNGEKYVKAQLESFRLQSRQADEVLIFDDKSTDSTSNIIKHFISGYGLSHWKFFENVQNVGYSKNFLSLIKKATGEIIFLADQDDIWVSNKLEIMVECFEKNNNIWLLSCDYTRDKRYELQEKLNSLYSKNLKTVKVENIGSISRNLFRPGNCQAISSKLKPYLFQFIGESSLYGHDLAIEQTARILGKAYHLIQVLNYWRSWSNSVTTVKSSLINPLVIEKYIASYSEYIFLYDAAIEFLEKLSFIDNRSGLLTLYKKYKSERLSILKALKSRRIIFPFTSYHSVGCAQIFGMQLRCIILRVFEKDNKC